MSFHAPEKARVQHPLFPDSTGLGNNGCFRFKHEGVIYNCIASDGEGWEHVSVHVIDNDKIETPTWDEMCRVKSIFWDEQDQVIQYHPPKSEYVNCHPNVLHLWRPTNQTIPSPPSYLVGPK